MSPEEFERLKQQEKEHLRKIRQIKQQGTAARRRAGLSDALGGLADSLDALGETDRLTRQMQEGQARTEARFEMAADAVRDRAEREEAEQTLRESEADGLLAQMRAEMFGSSSTPGASQRKPSGRREPAGSADAGSPDPSRTEAGTTSSKSIGRARPEPESDEPAADRSAKSIGRRRS